ncbi:MAG TPA: trimethylamine methyltransferase family protein [Phycisphaerae bacterium]|nr:trimethylamine methyltransferase family protein [Phycisphaerae bacterium]
MAEFAFVSPEEARRFHAASLRVLETIGVRIEHPESVDLLLGAGARRGDDGRVLIPGRMVNEALEKAVKGFGMYDRLGGEAFRMEAGNTVFGTGSDAIYNIDRATWELRNSTLADVRENVRIVDALPNYDFTMSMALPHEVPESKLYPTVFAEMAANTTKPIISALTNLDDLRRVHEIAKIIAGGADALRARPFYGLYLEPISPLHIEASIAERALFCAEHEVPYTFAAGANSGSGSPITPEGGVVQGGAESLAGLVLGTLKNPNARFIYGSNTSSADMRTTVVSYGAPEWYKTVAIYAEMGKFYKLPTWGTAGCTDAHRLDAQAGLEAHEGVVLALQSGTTLAHDVGYMAYGSLYDARMLVLCDSMIARAKMLLRPLDMSDNGLAIDAIEEVVREDMPYLAIPHTAENFRQCLWLPPAYINRTKMEHYHTEQQLNEMLGAEVRRILAEHKPEPLAQAAAEQIEAYLATC